MVYLIVFNDIISNYVNTYRVFVTEEQGLAFLTKRIVSAMLSVYDQSTIIPTNFILQYLDTSTNGQVVLADAYVGDLSVVTAMYNAFILQTGTLPFSWTLSTIEA